jgi:hypothetical protein
MLNGTPRATCKLVSCTRRRADAEQTIAEIESLERIFAMPDTRPMSATDHSARRHDEMLAHSPWFRLWQQYGVCYCRAESPVLRMGETER